jgi:hypothetical protein
LPPHRRPGALVGDLLVTAGFELVLQRSYRAEFGVQMLSRGGLHRQVRIRLTAGGRWIRTLGPPLEGHHCRCRYLPGLSRRIHSALAEHGRINRSSGHRGDVSTLSVGHPQAPRFCAAALGPCARPQSGHPFVGRPLACLVSGIGLNLMRPHSRHQTRYSVDADQNQTFEKCLLYSPRGQRRTRPE